MPARQCPYCDQPTDGEHCEIHSVPTVEADLFDRPPEVIKEGALLAGRYRVERFLAEGGFGYVWVARQLAMNRTVALKVLRRAERRGLGALKRFYREALALSRLAHPNVVQVFDFGVDRESRAPFIVFELLEGQTLTDLVAKHGALSERRAVGIMAQVARALVEAHAQGIVHRDLKPNNVMVSKLRDGSRHVKVLDFGLAKIQEDGDHALTGITAPGALLGAPHFMSPEQAAGARIDYRSDLYSFGCLLHALVTARPPFSSAQAADLIAAHLRKPPPPLPAELKASEALVILHRSLLAKNPLERPASAAVVAEILNALADGEEIDAQTALERARKQAFSGAIPHSDSLAAYDERTLGADPTGPMPIIDEASTAPPPPPKRANTSALRALDMETVPPVTPEPLAPISSVATSRSRKKHGVGIAFIGGALAVGLIGGIVLSQRDEPVEPPPAESMPPPLEPVTPVVQAKPTPKLRLTSHPAGAEVLVDGEVVGKTPLELDRDTKRIELRFPGYRTQEVALGDQSELEVKLEKLEKRSVKVARPPVPPPTEDPPPSKRKYPVW